MFLFPRFRIFTSPRRIFSSSWLKSESAFIFLFRKCSELLAVASVVVFNLSPLIAQQMNAASKTTTKRIKMTSTTSATPLSIEQRLVSLEGKLTTAEAELLDWSSLVKKAILGEEEHKGKEAAYKEQQVLWLARVTALENQIAGKRLLPPSFEQIKNIGLTFFKSVAHKCHAFENSDEGFNGK